MKKVWKKRAVVAAVLVFVCAAVYMNWRYSDEVSKTSKVLGESTLVSSGKTTVEDKDSTKKSEKKGDAEKNVDKNAVAEDDYFATARLSRQQARDSAISMLQDAETDKNATEDVLNEASQTLQVLAAYTVAESQIESIVTAKGYADCVAFMGDNSISVVVADKDGLNESDVARIKDIVISETDYTAEQIKIMEAN